MQQKALKAFFILAFTCFAWASVNSTESTHSFVETGECQVTVVLKYMFCEKFGAKVAFLANVT